MSDMEVWLQIVVTALITILGVAVMLWLMHIQNIRMIERVTERVTERVMEISERYIGEAIKAIHEDIKHSQEKLERKLKNG